MLGLGAGSFEYSVADPPTRRKQVSPWTNRPIFVPWGSVCVKAKGSQKYNGRERELSWLDKLMGTWWEVGSWDLEVEGDSPKLSIWLSRPVWTDSPRAQLNYLSQVACEFEISIHRCFNGLAIFEINMCLLSLMKQPFLLTRAAKRSIYGKTNIYDHFDPTLQTGFLYLSSIIAIFNNVSRNKIVGIRT